MSRFTPIPGVPSLSQVFWHRQRGHGADNKEPRGVSHIGKRGLRLIIILFSGRPRPSYPSGELQACCEAPVWVYSGLLYSIAGYDASAGAIGNVRESAEPKMGTG